MSLTCQRTLRQRIDLHGKTLHSGIVVKMSLLPAPSDTGIVFIRKDLNPHVKIQAKPENVVDSSLATRLGVRGTNGTVVRVDTVEHLMAAVYALGIDNLFIELNGIEIPSMDGSAAPFLRLMRAAGIKLQDKPKKILVVKKPIEIRDGNRMAGIRPFSSLKISCLIDYNHPIISKQHLDVEFSLDSFMKDIASARTFGFLKDVEKMKKAGLALGGSLENAVVINDTRVLNEGGLRFTDEFVRHKILDAIGDLALVGMPVAGHLIQERSGHALNNMLSLKLLANPANYEIIELGSTHRDTMRHDFAYPAYAYADAAA